MPAVSVDKKKKSGRMPKLTAFCCGLPVLLILVIVALFIRNSRAPQIDIPTPKPPVPNGFDDFVQAGRMAGAMQHKSPLSLRGPLEQTETFANYAAAHKDAGPALALMRQGLGKQCMEPPVRSIRAVNLQFLSVVRDLARTVASEGYYQDLIGQPYRAADTYLDGFEMGALFPNGGGAISMLVGNACESIALARFERTLPRLSAAELAMIAARFEKIAARKTPYSAILREEGNSSIAIQLEAFRDPKSHSWQAFVDMAKELTAGPGGSVPPPSVQQSREAVSMMLADKGAMLRDYQHYIEQMIKESEQPYSPKSHVPVPHNSIAEIMADVLHSTRSKCVAQEAVETILRVEVALYRYKKEKGHFSDNLSSLTPSYLRVVPPDPFGGGADVPLRYRPENGGQSFLLYSLGMNMQDDGGRRGKHALDTHGDIVANQIWRSRWISPGTKGN